MAESAVTFEQILDIIIRLLAIVLPIILAWALHQYVRGTRAEKDIAAIVHLANDAIDYVENLDKRGDLNLPPEVKKGAHKLKVAGAWLEKELARANITITEEEAQQWISAQFQKRVGDVRMMGGLGQLAKTAVSLVQNMARNNLIDIPPEADRILYLTELAADWLIVQAAANGIDVSREEAMTWIRAELLKSLNVADERLPDNERLARLAQQAVAFLQDLKARGQLAIQAGATGNDVEMDVALAWLLAEVAKEGLPVTTEQITQALNKIMVRQA